MSEHRQGPVRSEAARASILGATATLFQTRGYDQLTMEGIAAEAGVSKQTIYRWWPSKSALVSDCLLEGLILPDRFNVPSTGDVRADILAWLQAIFRVLEQPGGEDLLRSLIAAAAENVDVGRRLHESLGATSSVINRLQEAVEASQLQPDAPLAEMGEALFGAVILRALSRSPADTQASARLVDAVLGTAPR
ncbi:TetR/AcrR family transcriptional regulator [Microbacterium sp. STN6]|uniref:TetR/AcrR family transcriptional regulator n=1 Tax=Microbacterium sp. STN6 TaxID=2995588 RepID=UPI002260EE55|nr:TetR/AcrR family transcriptional regulator [Microbacterium sp. STN6]MCX7521394.1 TetR/AcrR family transcriptional regulator [Microbacterium sp. STN6]